MIPLPPISTPTDTLFPYTTLFRSISSRNLLYLLLPERIREALSEHACPPEYLELEITESSIMPNPGRSLGILRKIRDMGVKVAIDDFDTGYYSLSYLQKLPVSSLKIDRSFIVEMELEADTSHLLNSINQMSPNLGISVQATDIKNTQ